MKPNHQLRFPVLRVILFVALLVNFPSCGLLDIEDPGVTLGHQISIANRTSDEVFVEFSVYNRKANPGEGYASYTNQVQLDSGYVLEANHYGNLIRDDYSSNRTKRLNISNISQKVDYLNVYKMDGSDTLFAEIDLLDSARWYYTNNDPLTFGRIIHYYTFSIEEEDFD